MNKFKAGDKVRSKKDDRVDIVESVPGDCDYDENYFLSHGLGMLTKKNNWVFQKDWELIDTNKTFMTSIVEKIKLITKSEPEKSAIKAGIRSTDDQFTSEGKEAFIEYLYQQHKADFDTKVVQVLLTDSK